ncbi:MAG: transposase [Gammaproteobacteria bacterium]|nr:transposase [Gammaproteobacteria bacterium]
MKIQANTRDCERSVVATQPYDADVTARRPHAKNLRKGRISQVGLYYFLTTSVAGQRRIFTKREYATSVLDAVRWLHDASRFFVDAAVVMPDHLHLAGRLDEGTLSKVMHTLKSYSAHRLAGAGIATPVWQRGFHDHALRGDEDYRIRVRYLVENPVRAGLVERVEDYPHLILPGWWRD